MKNFKFFPTLQAYRKYIYTDVFKISEFRDNVVYRAPIFFEQSEDFEFSHFTQYFNFVLDRKDYYKNDFVRSMYFAHDFVHMLFRNPLRVGEITFEEFCTILNNNEWVASNETETLTYHRVPDMRSESLPYTILYDILMSAGYKQQPSIKELLKLRADILFEEKYNRVANEIVYQDGGVEVFKYLRKFKVNNAAWCRLWYDNFPRPANPYEAFPYEEDEIYAPLTSYDVFLENFNQNGPYNTQENYEKNVLKNVRNLVYLTNSEVPLPNKFSECEATLKLLEGKIVMRDTAQEFHETYIKSKPIGTHAVKIVN